MLGLRLSWDTINHLRAHPGLRTFAHGCAQTPGAPQPWLSLTLHSSLGIPKPENRGPRLPAQTESW